jgi:hypothetical protein
MKYKLINSVTKEETICDKVTVDNIDYYYIDESIPYRPNGGTNGNFICLDEIQDNINHGIKFGEPHYISPLVTNVGSCGGCREIVATNNPSIDVPKVIDEADSLAYDFAYRFQSDPRHGNTMGIFKKGYNTSQETHPFTEEDMISFCIWVSTNHDESTCTYGELLNTWKEERIKTIYYQ